LFWIPERQAVALRDLNWNGSFRSAYDLLAAVCGVMLLDLRAFIQALSLLKNIPSNMQDRFYIAASLREIGRLLALKGENPFKAQAYERGARALENLQGDLDVLVKTRRLTDVRGIGSALASVIEEIHTTGECWALGQLRDELPPGAIELSGVPGLNLKKIIALHDALRVESIGSQDGMRGGTGAKDQGLRPENRSKNPRSRREPRGARRESIAQSRFR
jgi:hypothetical protein